jgi:putative effector of murein hydrolase
VRDMLFALIALVAAIAAVYEIYAYLQQKANNVSHTPLIIAIICGLVALVLGGLFLAGRVNKTEEIHVTE